MVACMRPGVVRYGSIHQCRGWKEYSSLSSDLANRRLIQCHVTEEVSTTELQYRLFCVYMQLTILST